MFLFFFVYIIEYDIDNNRECPTRPFGLGIEKKSVRLFTDLSFLLFCIFLAILQ